MIVVKFKYIMANCKGTRHCHYCGKTFPNRLRTPLVKRGVKFYTSSKEEGKGFDINTTRTKRSKGLKLKRPHQRISKAFKSNSKERQMDQKHHLPHDVNPLYA
ncbi:hypothetical protein KP509_29G022400 [Ceratopteris richardii]|uniref:Uncharacterized protein n=1 Tax=Ceratopteris richardii TaxID=49495 RepID=A0A8T2R6Z3_CERRI|nr:hypothetical protein KP509_29G022400 [Ceratopteris richardii]